MTNHSNHPLTTSRSHPQEQKPAQEARKAVFASRGRGAGEQFNVPKGCIAWIGDTLRAEPVREVGAGDTATLLYALHNFGYLIPRSGPLTRTLADFAALIELHAARLPVRPVADTLHRLSA